MARSGAILGAWVAALGLVALFRSPGAAAVGGVEVVADRGVYAAGERGTLKVVNRTGGPIWVPGCRPFEVQEFEEDRYRVARGRPCPSEGEAREVPTGATELPLEVPDGTGGEVFRVVLTWGTGCRKGLPLSSASCHSFGHAVSSRFRVSRSGR